jgi:hypothetical protein
MPSPVNSFDVFDTLIARRCVEPRQVLFKLEQHSGVAGLAEARLTADRTLGALGRPYQLRQLWQEVVRVLGLDEPVARRLMELEIQIEHEESIPITENLALVKDGDLLVSDTYLPAQVVRSLLLKAGLDRQVGLALSNDGKFRGRIWRELLEQTSIREHMGDNPHSDGRTPTQSGIRAVIYTGAQFSPAERSLAQSGWEPLARLVREVRLANPFPTSRPQERHLWGLTCQHNFPLLYFASLWLERSALAAAARELFFVSRDCWMWLGLFRRLFPHRRVTYLYASRLCLMKPSPSYLDYFEKTWHEGGLIVDLSSTGASWAALFARLGQRCRCRFIGWIDDYSYVQGGPGPADWLEVEVVFRNSEMPSPVSKAVELLNYAPYPVVEDVLLLPGGEALPVLGESLEYNRALPEAAGRAFEACVKRLDHFPELARARAEGVAERIKSFVGLICSEPHLPSIYSGHLEADLAYQRRLLG